MPSPILLEANSGSLPVLPSHRNSGLEIVFIERGHLRWEIEGKLYDIPPGSVFFTFPWERHGSVEEFEPGHLWHFVVLAMKGAPPRRTEFPPELYLSSDERGAILRALQSARCRHWMPGARIPWLVLALIREFRGASNCGRGTVRRLAAQLLAEMAEELSRPIPALPFATSTVRRIRIFLEELERRPEEDWTLDEMADRCKVGRSQLAEIVLSLTGDPPMTHLRRLRVQSARRLLRETPASVTDIALKSGFSTSQHFARIFLQFTGCTASAYRRRHRPSS